MASEVAPCMPLQLFRRGPGRRPRVQEVCRRLSDNIKALETAGTQTADQLAQLRKTTSDDAQKQLQVILEVFEDAAERKGNWPTEEVGELFGQFLAADLPVRLVTHLAALEFEARKDVIGVFSALLRLGPALGVEQKIQDYVKGHSEFFGMLVDGYQQPEVATHCGMMLRSCARNAQLVEAFLAQPEVVLRLLSFTRHGSFDISSDAFSSLHAFMLTHKKVSALFLEKHFREFFKVYNNLLESDDYVTQRQALKLLGEVLLDRNFLQVMLMYISDDQYLQIHMNLLRRDSKAIQLEAFHVFKIFVANPQKPPRVQYILYNNKERLIRKLEAIRPNRQDDAQFNEDRGTVVGKLQALEQPQTRSSSKAAPPNSEPAGNPPGSGATACTENVDNEAGGFIEDVEVEGGTVENAEPEKTSSQAAS